MFNNIFRTFLVVCCLTIAFSGQAATYYKTIQTAKLMAVDKKKRTVVLRNEIYHLKRGVKIIDSMKKFPNISSLVENVGIYVKFETIKNRRTGRVEISSIRLLHT